MGLAEIAKEAAYEADAPKRAAEEKRRREVEAYQALVEQQATAMLTKAQRKLKRLFSIDATDWEVLEKHPTYVVLRDPDDKPSIISQKLTLTVTTWNTKGNASKVLYAPYENYGKKYTNNRRGDGLDWHCGPEVTDALTLGQAIQKHERDIIESQRSMPDYLP